MTTKNAIIILACLSVLMLFFVVYFYNEMKMEKMRNEELYVELRKVEDVKNTIDSEEAKQKALLEKVADPEKEKELNKKSVNEQEEMRQNLINKIK